MPRAPGRESAPGTATRNPRAAHSREAHSPPCAARASRPLGEGHQAAQASGTLDTAYRQPGSGTSSEGTERRQARKSETPAQITYPTFQLLVLPAAARARSLPDSSLCTQPSHDVRASDPSLAAVALFPDAKHNGSMPLTLPFYLTGPSSCVRREVPASLAHPFGHLSKGSLPPLSPGMAKRSRQAKKSYV